ncbi:GM23788 [Drosophila sechellia]|uniref:GM23788 n=1 Tax=Drosophila sechellia TaxID=7238 RepID=B4HKG9_DROSE|nr:GM23788 [Drosophila sechellia]
MILKKKKMHTYSSAGGFDRRPQSSKFGNLYGSCWDILELKSNSEFLHAQEIRVQKIIEHPTFSPVSFENDAALLILKQSFELNDHINVICLPDQGAAPPPTSVCYANGWSKNEYDDSVRYSTRMKRIPLHIGKCIDRSSIFGQTIYPHTSFLCAAGLRSLYIGDGDGGGPLACPLENPRENRYQLSGILSLKFVNLEGLVSDVSSMRSWIDQEMTANNFDKSYYTA